MTAGLSPNEIQIMEEYDAATELQIENEKPVKRKGVSLSDIYKAFEAADLDGIRELHLDIGVMRGLLERLQEGSHAYQMIQYFIRVELNMIDNLSEEIQHERRQIEELNRLSG